MDDFKLKSSSAINGTLLPHSIQIKQMQEEQKEAEDKHSRKHDYFVATFSAVASAFFTNIDRIIKFIAKLIS